MNPISLYVCVHNEEARIGEFLRHHAPLCDQVVLVDQASTDQTLGIAREVLAEWGGEYEFVLEPCRGFSEASYPFALPRCNQEWLLVLFPDETLTERFEIELPGLICDQGLDAYRLLRHTTVENGPSFLEPTLRLVRRNLARTVPIVHNDPTCVTNRVRNLEYTCIDHNKTALEQHEDNVRYSRLGTVTWPRDWKP